MRLYCKHLQEKDQVVALKLPPHAACVGPIIKRIFPSTVLVANLRLPGEEEEGGQTGASKNDKIVSNCLFFT